MLFWGTSSSILEVDGGIKNRSGWILREEEGRKITGSFDCQSSKFLNLQETGMLQLLCQSKFCPPSRASSISDSPNEISLIIPGGESILLLKSVAFI